MNVAICFSGKLNKSNINKNFIEKIKGYSNLDAFIHLWSNETNKDLLESFKPKKFLFETQKNFGNDALLLMEPLSKIKNLYYSDYYNSQTGKWSWDLNKKPISDRIFYGKSINKEIKNDKEYAKNVHDFGFGLLSQFYSRLLSNEFKNFYQLQNNVTYDLVIRARLDTYIENEIDLTKLDKNKLTTFYSPRFYNNIWAINDLFAISNSENMDVYCSLYFHLHQTLLDAFNNEKFNYLCHESLLLQHLTNQNVQLDFIRNNKIKLLP